MIDPWASLNDRQRAYLRTLYDCDQDTEALRRGRAARGDWDRAPASERRWQLYGPTAPPSPLYRTLQAARLVNQGTGATWRALEDRGLVKCRDVLDAFGVPLLQVQITPKGRKAVRAATGEQRRKAPPRGQLRAWLGSAYHRSSQRLSLPSSARRCARRGQRRLAPNPDLASLR